MKKLLIIEDDQIIANIYRNKLAVDGFTTEVASDGEQGLEMVKTFRPDAVVLDLMLPRMSGVEVIQKIRSAPEFAELPIIVFSNTYLTNLVQEAWRAGATKCLAKASCSPKEFLSIIRNTIGSSPSSPGAQPPPDNADFRKADTLTSNDPDAEFQTELRMEFIESLPATLVALRATIKNLVKGDNEMDRLRHLHELYRRIHAINGNAGITGLFQIARMADAVEALLKELYEQPKKINPSTLRTVASAVDFLGLLFEHGTLADKQELPAANILVVDDEAISRRAVVYALEKARLPSVSVEEPNAAYKLLLENPFDLVFLDVDMPGMTGYELCAKLRRLPLHKKTPVVFVTGLNDFENRASSTMSGGNDFIAKPFLFIELTVKALIHILRAKVVPAN